MSAGFLPRPRNILTIINGICFTVGLILGWHDRRTNTR